MELSSYFVLYSRYCVCEKQHSSPIDSLTLLVMLPGGRWFTAVSSAHFVLKVLSFSLGKRLIGLCKQTNRPFIRDLTGSCTCEHEANHTHQVTVRCSHQQRRHRRKNNTCCSPKSFLESWGQRCHPYCRAEMMGVTLVQVEDCICAVKEQRVQL